MAWRRSAVLCGLLLLLIVEGQLTHAVQSDSVDGLTTVEEDCRRDAVVSGEGSYGSRRKAGDQAGHFTNRRRAAIEDEEDLNVLSRFAEWAEDRAANGNAGQASEGLEEGEHLGLRRRLALKRLIERNPAA